MLEFLFGMLLGYSPALAVFIFSCVVLFVINIFYKVLIKQGDAKQIKQRVKELNKDFKEAQKLKETERSKKIMGDMMSENNKLMRMTMKPMIVSMIIVIIFLPSMSTFYGDRYASADGTLVIGGTNYTVTNDAGTVNIGTASCSTPCTQKIGQHDYRVSLEGEKVKVALIVATLPLLGYSFGWLGWYIICSVPLVMVIRKFMKIYV